MWPVDTTAFAKRVRLKKVFDVFFKEDQPLIAVADSQNSVKVTVFSANVGGLSRLGVGGCN